MHLFKPPVNKVRATLLAIGLSTSILLYGSIHAAGLIPIPDIFQPDHPMDMEAKLVDLEEQLSRGNRKNQMKVRAAIRQTKRSLCEQGKARYCPEYASIPEAKNVDIDRLAVAVAWAETSNCTTGTAVIEEGELSTTEHNCHGIMGCRNGKCGPKTFRSKEESFLAFKKLWLSKYGDRFPTLEDAKRYSGHTGDTWLERVRIVYNSEKSIDFADSW